LAEATRARFERNAAFEAAEGAAEFPAITTAATKRSGNAKVIAEGEAVDMYKSLLCGLKDTYDYSCY
jgi:hypothetical protein